MENEKIYKRVKTPTILQMEALECGAASLAMIMATYGLYKPLEELRIETGVSRDGVKASNILKVGRKYGFEVTAYRKEPEALKFLPVPMIIHWNFNHFLVLEGFKGNYVYLNDPAAGKRKIHFEEFDKSYTGIAIVFKKLDTFKKSGEKKSIIKSLIKRLDGLQTVLSYITLAGLFLVIPGILIPVFSKIFVDDILINNMDSWIKPLLIGMILTAIFRMIVTGIQKHYLLKLETHISIKNSTKFFWHVLRLPAEFFNQRFAGEIGMRIFSNDRVANVIAEKLTSNVIDLITLFFYALIMFFYDKSLTLIVVSITLSNILILKLVEEKRKEASQKLLIENGKLMGASMAGLSAIESIKAGGTENDFFEKWAGYQALVVNTEQRISLSSQILGQLPDFLSMINMIIILSLGGFKVMNGQMSVGMLIAFQTLMTSFLEPVKNIMVSSAQYQELEGDMNRLDDVLNYKTDELAGQLEVDYSINKAKLEGNLTLENINFGYNLLEPPLIENFNLKLTPGKRVALVGGSGSGKTTIAKLIGGVTNPWDGKILFDNEERTRENIHIICNSLAVVDQNISLFEATLRDNITLWDSSITDDEILNALKAAEIYDEIMIRPGGLDQLVKENGMNYSGGQRQRIEIARALAINPSILILDEATSALDPVIEEKIDKNIRERGCTCVIVAHRLSTIRDCDEIIVLERGKIVERGTHDELIKNQKYYAELVKSM